MHLKKKITKILSGWLEIFQKTKISKIGEMITMDTCMYQRVRNAAYL